MAGLFGFFNYEKAGPGIEKDAPQKRGPFRFFEFFFRNFWKLLVNNLVYALISLPILTNGLAQAGITNIARNIARDKHSFGVSDFKDTIKKNWKQGLILGIINILVYVILIFDAWFLNSTKQSTLNTIYLGAIFFAMFVWTFMNYFMWTLMITFKFSIKQILKNSFKFVFINIKMNLVCFFTLLLVLAIYIAILFLAGSYWPTALIFELLIFTLTYPGFKALLVQFCTFPAIKKFIIDPYYKEHPDDDIERRKDLGVYDEEELDSEDENVFSDKSEITEEE